MHSKRAKQNFTLQLKEQMLFLQQDLKHEREALKRVQRFVWWGLPGTKSMIAQHERGVKKTLTDIARMKIRIKRRYSNGEIYKISL